VPGWADVHRAGFRKDQIFPDLERTPDLTRGQERLAAEVALAAMTGQSVPSIAWSRAVETLTVMARG
jgi:hypothetical protein